MKKIGMFFICIAFLGLLVGCDALTNSSSSKVIPVDDIIIDESYFPVNCTLDNFDVSQIEVYVHFEDHTKILKTLQEVTSDTDYAKFSSAGTFTVTLKYEDYSENLTVTILPGSTASGLVAIKEITSAANYTINGIVTQILSNGYLLADGTGTVLVEDTSVSSYSVGNIVTVTGTASSFGTSAYKLTSTSSNLNGSTLYSVANSNPTVIKPAQFKTYSTSASIYDYVTISAVVKYEDSTPYLVIPGDEDSKITLDGVQSSYLTTLEEDATVKVTGLVTEHGEDELTVLLSTAPVADTTYYAVVFFDSDKTTILSTQYVKFGNNAVAPEATKSGYTFEGWVDFTTLESKSYTNITSNTILVAKYNTMMINTWKFEESASKTVYYSFLNDSRCQYFENENFITEYAVKKEENTYSISIDGSWKEISIDIPKVEITFNDKTYTLATSTPGQGFLGYTSSKPDTTIDSKAELIDYMEYTVYNNICSADDAEEITLTYVSTTEACNTQIQAAFSEMTMPVHVALAPSTMSSNGTVVKVKLFLNADISATAGKTTYTNADDCTQAYQVAYEETIPTRTSTFNDFAIEKVIRTAVCTNSEQLFYAVEHDYRPICSSSALTIYNKAKDILRNIITNDMTEKEKIKAIYDYLIYNVCYDHAVADSTTLDLAKSDCFYLEGVFNSKRAVCDGISEAFSLLCNMEGINCIRVVGKTNDLNESGHAWNKVYTGGKWYVVDATNGEGKMTVNAVSYGVINYQYYLITDAIYDNFYVATNFTGSTYLANTEYDFYAEKYGTYLENDIDLVIDSQTELNTLFSYLKTLDTAKITNSSFSFELNMEATLDELGIMLQTAGTTSELYTLKAYSKSDRSIVTCYFQ